jgi:hypothetical protein
MNIFHVAIQTEPRREFTLEQKGHTFNFFTTAPSMDRAVLEGMGQVRSLLFGQVFKEVRVQKMPDHATEGEVHFAS